MGYSDVPRPNAFLACSVIPQLKRNYDFVTTKYDDLLDYHPLDIYSIRINEIIRKFVRMRYGLADCEQ